VLSQELVGPVVGADLQRSGIYATLASIVGITIYIAPALPARVRDRRDRGDAPRRARHAGVPVLLRLRPVAQRRRGILTITGYSVNDTIVIFDRVRENMRSKRRDSLEKIVNESVNQTLSRTIITAGTTFLAVFALYLFGGEVLEGFAFTMLVGIISGTYSTIFIAAAIAIILGNRQAKGRTAGAQGFVTPTVDLISAALLGWCRDSRSSCRFQLRPPDPGAGVLRLGSRRGSASRSTWPATSARCWRWWRSSSPTSGS
jgi:preprotein translocase subunit SecF